MTAASGCLSGRTAPPSVATLENPCQRRLQLSISFFRAQGAELTAALHDLPAQLRLEPLRLGFWRRF